ncbi:MULTISPECIES: hypothetical protein [unclassified Streptomyces]|uniref:hypothetical protein n=1 Tax=unclassified Streptomyces TaxID=2593676 RepID=UPI00093A5EBE|nr:hypothetical protein [Streptomyces sp. TSRI0107]OKJ87560.1 hypothetical protein AMK31_10330 [Streptomyces sp. TSRI0107]
MLLEAFSSALLGLVLAWTYAVRLPHRLPARPLVLSTGVAGGLFGAFLIRTAVDAAGFLLVLLGAVVVSVASLSLLLRPAGRLRRHSATA